MPGSSDGASVIDRSGLDVLIELLQAEGLATVGPQVRDGAIVPGPIATSADLPEGWHDHQAPGRYEIDKGDDHSLFSWAVGPQSPKGWLLPAEEVVWRATARDGAWSLHEPAPDPGGVALVGLRPCEVAAVATLDAVLAKGTVADPAYLRRRRATVLVAVECGAPASTCFCASMGTGPEAGDKADLVLTELDQGERFLVRAITPRGVELLSRLPARHATGDDLRARQAVLDGARAAISRSLDTEGLPELLAANLEHPRWQDVAERCLACGNCTMVCPTCFCTDVADTTDLGDAVTRTRRWSSCFDFEHSFLHGGAVRSSTASRYRQWMVHKLGTWHAQFGMSGCVGCGRCITWCPVGIDITEEVAAIRADQVSGGEQR